MQGFVLECVYDGVCALQLITIIFYGYQSWWSLNALLKRLCVSEVA